MGLPDGPERPGVVMRVWLSFRAAHAEEAAEWLLAQEPTGVLEAVYQRYLTGTASLDPKEALAIAEKAEDPALRERMLTAVGMGWMKTDREGALAWLDTVELAPELEERVRQAGLLDPTKTGVIVPTP